MLSALRPMLKLGQALNTLFTSSETTSPRNHVSLD